jgi:hypothetical protein
MRLINILQNLHDKYIKGTEPGALVPEKTVLLCNLTFTVQKQLCLPKRAYINTKVLKHLYDKRPARQYDFTICYLHKLIKYPDKIYENKDSKRGGYCFVKTIKGRLSFASVELKTENKNDEHVFIVTSYDVPEKYLKNYKLLWSWKDGEPSS